MTTLSSPYFHFKKNRKQLMVLVSVWQETLRESEKELSFLETYIASPIFYITPELLSEFVRFKAHLKKLLEEARLLLALANKHFSVINEWDEIDELTFEDFILNEHGKIETKILDFIKNYNSIKLEIFNYTGNKLIQKPEN